MSQTQFKKLHRSLLQAKHNQSLFSGVAEQIGEQVETASNDLDEDRFHLFPAPVLTVYWLWQFQCEAGINGMDQFVLDWLGMHSAEIHSALKEVGAHELARLLESAVSLARNAPAEFRRLADQSWYNQFPLSHEYLTLESINRPTFALMNELTDLAALYIRSHEISFFLN